jgi:hypothetical protein
LQLRDLSLNDLVILEKDNLPPLFNGPFKLVMSIEEDGELIGSFWVRITAEISILLKEDLSRLVKARAINEIGKFLYDEIPEKLGISDSFITFDGEFDLRYIKILKKHFNFEEVKALRVRRTDG